MHHDILLDSRIRDWVFFPILLMMFLFGVIRYYVSILLKSDKKPDLVKMRQGQTLTRAIQFRENYSHITKDGAKSRKAHFSTLLSEEIKPQTLTALSDPSTMVDMMKGNMAMMIPNFAVFGWLSYFYSGFVLAKFPFPLTQRFKAMVQRGIILNSLDVSYVTSASIFFLFLFGSQGVFALLFGDENLVDDAKLMQQQMTGGLGSNPMVDYGPLFIAEKENIELIKV